MDVCAHWGLHARPFEPTCDPRFFYQSSAHAEALARLQFLAEDGALGFGVLSGEIGSGKTFTAAVFAATLDLRFYTPVFLENANLGFRCILDQLNCALAGRQPDGAVRSQYELATEFRSLLDSRVRARRVHLVLVLDEAQELSAADLGELRCLMNTAGMGRGAMSVVLVGQPELRERVRGTRAVNSRVGMRFHLGCLSRNDVQTYLVHRLRSAGHPTGRLFSSGAVDVIAQRSGGVPRDVNRIAKLTLHHAAMRGSRAVGEADACPVAADGAAA